MLKISFRTSRQSVPLLSPPHSPRLQMRRNQNDPYHHYTNKGDTNAPAASDVLGKAIMIGIRLDE
jgi:hypothetical protein